MLELLGFATMKASGRQEFVIQTKQFVTTSSTSCLMSNYVGQICHGRQLSHISIHVTVEECQSQTFLCIIFGECTLYNQEIRTYQAVHFWVGNVVGLLRSYLKWTNKMSSLFKQCAHFVTTTEARLYHYPVTNYSDMHAYHKNSWEDEISVTARCIFFQSCESIFPITMPFARILLTGSMSRVAARVQGAFFLLTAALCLHLNSRACGMPKGK